MIYRERGSRRSLQYPSVWELQSYVPLLFRISSTVTSHFVMHVVQVIVSIYIFVLYTVSKVNMPVVRKYTVGILLFEGNIVQKKKEDRKKGTQACP
jgi:hypothetical protein